MVLCEGGNHALDLERELWSEGVRYVPLLSGWDVYEDPAVGKKAGDWYRGGRGSWV